MTVHEAYAPQQEDDRQRLMTEPVQGVLSFLLIEDHPMYAEGFRSAIHRIFPRARLQVASSGSAARPLLAHQPFDLVFLDINLPDVNGLDLLVDLQNEGIWQPIAILTGAVDALAVETARRRGALGLISKRSDDTCLESICSRLLAGDTAFEIGPSSLSPGEALEDITSRELEVLQKLATGLENSQICKELGISDSTLRTHLRALFQKMQVPNRTACVVKGIRLGWV
jgi:DNA-binding NarL/FixJ family response regulator